MVQAGNSPCSLLKLVATVSSSSRCPVLTYCTLNVELNHDGCKVRGCCKLERLQSSNRLDLSGSKRLKNLILYLVNLHICRSHHKNCSLFTSAYDPDQVCMKIKISFGEMLNRYKKLTFTVHVRMTGILKKCHCDNGDSALELLTESFPAWNVSACICYH